MRRRSGPQQLQAIGKGIWCNSSHDGPRATAERQHPTTIVHGILGQVSRWRLACGSMSKSGLGPGLACLGRVAAEGRRRKMRTGVGG